MCLAHMYKHVLNTKENKRDIALNKSDDFLLDPFCIYTIYVLFCFVFFVKNYTNKILFKLK